MSKWLYWVLVFALVGFGSVAIFSIGAPFLLLGFTLAVLGPLRTRPFVFWPVVSGMFGFIVGYILVAPLGCTSEPTLQGAGDIGRTACSSVLGITYRGTGSYNPPLWPAVFAALVLGLTFAIMARLFLARGGRGDASSWKES
jgi:O-antigen/teichoic acid export membrane protein